MSISSRILDQITLAELGAQLREIQGSIRFTARGVLFTVVVQIPGGTLTVNHRALGVAVDYALRAAAMHTQVADVEPVAGDDEIEAAPTPDPDGCRIGPAPTPDPTGTQIGMPPAPEIEESAS